jgi:hypothetical protein
MPFFPVGSRRPPIDRSTKQAVRHALAIQFLCYSIRQYTRIKLRHRNRVASKNSRFVLSGYSVRLREAFRHGLMSRLVKEAIQRFFAATKREPQVLLIFNRLDDDQWRLGTTFDRAGVTLHKCNESIVRSRRIGGRGEELFSRFLA